MNGLYKVDETQWIDLNQVCSVSVYGVALDCILAVFAQGCEMKLLRGSQLVIQKEFARLMTAWTAWMDYSRKSKVTLPNDKLGSCL